MTRTNSRLLLALACSFVLHLLPFVPPLLNHQAPAPKPTQRPLEARITPLARPEQPELKLDRPAPKPSSPEKPQLTQQASPARQSAAQANWTRTIRQHLQKLHQAGDFYPAEAIAQGLEGEALILLIIDESGHVVGARVEQSSGHRLLDDAALRAVRSVRSLPVDAPRETVLPVRFRLR